MDPRRHALMVELVTEFKLELSKLHELEEASQARAMLRDNEERLTAARNAAVEQRNIESHARELERLNIYLADVEAAMKTRDAQTAAYERIATALEKMASKT